MSNSLQTCCHVATPRKPSAICLRWASVRCGRLATSISVLTVTFAASRHTAGTSNLSGGLPSTIKKPNTMRPSAISNALSMWRSICRRGAIQSVLVVGPRSVRFPSITKMYFEVCKKTSGDDNPSKMNHLPSERIGRSSSRIASARMTGSRSSSKARRRSTVSLDEFQHFGDCGLALHSNHRSRSRGGDNLLSAVPQPTVSRTLISSHLGRTQSAVPRLGNERSRVSHFPPDGSNPESLLNTGVTRVFVESLIPKIYSPFDSMRGR
jgi:hypothetical protein